MKRNFPAVIAIAAFLVAGCEATYDMDGYPTHQARPGVRPAIGAVGGGASGALLCSRVGKGNGKVAMAAVCGIGGALAGLGIGNTMDRTDALQQDRMFRSPPGSQFRYQDQNTGSRGNLLMLQPTTDGGQYCREFQHEGYVGGRMQRMHGTACQQPDGSWKIVG